MFLNLMLKRNYRLLETAFNMHQSGLINPNTYILDLDAILFNGKAIKEEADRYGIKLYFMTKQFGRNPFIAAELMKLGYAGAVAVDYKEAEVLYKNGIKLGHVGHLVQIPANKVEEILQKKPEIITVYSLEKAYEISKAAEKLNMRQKIMLRVIDEKDNTLPGQYGGFYLEELLENSAEILKLPNLELCGLTSFPCFLVDKESKSIKKTNNSDTLIKAKKLLEDKLNIKIEQLNMPSATCVSNINKIAELGGTHGEPGHGLSGTTPLHILADQVEIPATVYVSEISHNLGDKSYCFGGGHYRRSLMEGALAGKNIKDAEYIETEAMDASAIDYYIGLKKNANVGDTAVFAFRTQIFVTRSEVAVVSGISTGKPQVVGIYDSQGGLIRSGA